MQLLQQLTEQQSDDFYKTNHITSSDCSIPKWQWLEHALKGYIKAIDHGYYKGMCDALARSAMQLDIAKWLNQKDLVNLLPEFNPLWLTGDSKVSGCYYWPIKDHESRISAFDRLINHYYSGEKKDETIQIKYQQYERP